MKREDLLIMPDDFSLQKEEHISAIVSLGDTHSAKETLPDLEMTFAEPKMKSSPIKIENAEHTRRGATSGLF